MKYVIWATMLGALSAASLPMGSWVGIQFRFSARLISVMAAFGAGALIAALSIELIAPTVAGLLESSEGSSEAQQTAFFAMIIGCIGGGLLYVGLSNLVNSKGGFLRNRSTILAYFKKQDKEKQEQLLHSLANYQIFHNFPPQHIETLMGVLRQVSYKPQEVIFSEGDSADAALIPLKGELSVEIDGQPSNYDQQKTEILNLIAVLKNTSNLGTLRAKTDVTALEISKDDFQKLRSLSPEFDENCRRLAHDHLSAYSEIVEEQNAQRLDWLKDAGKALDTDMIMPDYHQVKRAKESHSGAPLAIWLGILLDGIPESMVIGAGMLGLLSTKMGAGMEVGFMDVIPYTLIAGLFLSNFPEALSSSANMRAQGTSKSKIFLMWFSLMVITGLGAGLGYLLAEEFDHSLVVFLEGLAAGAMLTMIVAAMIPEAVLQGSGNLVGLSTLSGFLGAILFKLLE